MKQGASRFVSATGFDVFLPWYDVAVRAMARQTRLHEAVISAADQLLSQVSNQIAVPAPAVRLVDLGCGSGTLLLKFLQQELSLTGVDIDGRMLRQARRKSGADRIEWFEAPSYHTGLPPDSTHVVTCTLLMHHLSDDLKCQTLREALRIAAPGGVIVLADFARPQTWFARLRFEAVRLVDGRANTQANLDGRLPEMLQTAGWRNVKEEFGLATALGTVRGYTATKPSV